MKKVLSVLLVFLFLFSSPSVTWGARGRFVCVPVRDANETSPCSPTRKVEMSYTFLEELVQTEMTDKGLKLVYPGCQEYYFPGAPKIPFLSVPLTLARSEVITAVRVSFVQTKNLSLDITKLERFDPLKATNGEMTPSEISILPNRFPPDPISYHTSGNFTSRKGSIKIFPIYIQDNKILLNTQISLIVEIATFNNGPIRKQSVDHSIIITPDELTEQAMSLGQIQRIDGYKVEVVTLSMIQKEYEMADPPSFNDISFFEDVPEDMRSRFSTYDSVTARKIRTFLGNKQKASAVDYVTLMGDATYCPPSTYVFSLNNPDTYDRAIPSDFFYMTPLPEYDDYSLTIKVGRIPVRSVAEAKQYVEKLRRYRKALRKSWFNSITLFGGDLFEDDYYGEIQSNYMIQQGNFDGQTVTKKYQSSGLYKRDSILSTLSTGNNGFISMSSHGRGDYLRLPQGYVDSADIFALPKIDRLPIFVSDSCLNGSWDTRLSGIRYGTDSKLPFPTSFAEALVLSEGGAIAYVGGARINYAGMDYEYNDGLIEGHQLYNTDALLHRVFANYSDKESTLGAITFLGLSDFIQSDMSYPGDWMLKAVFGFCLLGDPTLRLPGKEKVDPPSIEMTKIPDYEASATYDIPTISLDSANQFKLTSSENELTISTCDYETWDMPLILKETIKPNPEGVYTFTLPRTPKTRLCVRIETTSGYELRYVFFTRFQQDIRLIPPESFMHMNAGQKVDVSFYVVNDGLESAQDVMVQAMLKGQVLYKKVIPEMNSGYVYPLTMNLSFEQPGIQNIEYAITPLKKETLTSDNLYTRNYIVSTETVQKIGVFQYKYESDGSQVASKIWMDQVNQTFTSQKKQIEVSWIHKNRIEFFDTLGLDMLVLYDSAYLENESSFISKLEDFTISGGKVLVIGPTSKKIRSLLGLKTAETYSIHQGDSSFQPFSLDPLFQPLFSQNSVSLPIFETVAPTRKPLENVIKSGGMVIGSTNDKLLFLTSYHNYMYYSGLLSKLDFERFDSVFTFFVDLLGFSLSYETPQYVFVSPGYALPVPV